MAGGCHPGFLFLFSRRVLSVERNMTLNLKVMVLHKVPSYEEDTGDSGFGSITVVVVFTNNSK